MKFFSTRGKDHEESFLNAVLQGLARDGGLYLPERWPNLSKDLEGFISLNYRDLCTNIFSYFMDDVAIEEIHQCVELGYQNVFEKDNLVDIKKVDDRYFLELYHGPTSAFKDFALCLLPQFMKLAVKKTNCNSKILILTATSGDTGKAALEGFKDVENTSIVVYYPTDGISEIQKRQMITQEGGNTIALGIRGNFDIAQSTCKSIFTDSSVIDKLGDCGYQLSSANSINIGRLLPQIIYYIYAYLQLCQKEEIQFGDKINVVVPTGNFGNILASYYAKKLGLPIDRCICASNRNNILTDFINTGIYDTNRSFHKTISPSMDILVSSNLERFLYEMTNDTDQVRTWMEDLQKNGKYNIGNNLSILKNNFNGYFANDEETYEEIHRLYQLGYLVDTHTAVASLCFDKYQKETGDMKPAMIASTASPFKFGTSVSRALGLKEDSNEFSLLKTIEKVTNVRMPDNLRNLESKKITQHDILDPDMIKNDLLNRVKEKKI
ncbi:MAG: threonine synthase [Tissierellia bacterium]|nr:threonine synthase [Tissierellia bacterium]